MGCIQLLPKSPAERSTRGPSSPHAIQPSGRHPHPPLPVQLPAASVRGFQSFLLTEGAPASTSHSALAPDPEDVPWGSNNRLPREHHHPLLPGPPHLHSEVLFLTLFATHL